MIAYEIQLRYVIRDKIQSETKFSPKKILSEKKDVIRKKYSWIFSQTEFVSDCILSGTEFVSDFQCAF